MNNWFHLVYSRGALNTYMANEAGFTVIPFGDQFYMVRNADNRQWALYSRKNMVE